MKKKKLFKTHRVPALSPNLPLPHLQVRPRDQDHFRIAQRVRLGRRRCRGGGVAPLGFLPLFRRGRRQFRNPLLERNERVSEPLLVRELGQHAADAAVREQPERQRVAGGGAQGGARGDGGSSVGIGRRH